MKERLMQIARTAGDFFSARSLSRIDQKEGHANFVTNIDREVEEYLQRSQTVLIPVGSIENHGKHMALGTDTLIPDRIVELLEEKSDVLIAPTIPYGSTDSITLDEFTRQCDDGNAYDLSGRKVDEHYKGVVIQKGKKQMR